MPTVTGLCLACEQDFDVPEREIKLAIGTAAQTNGKALISCTHCGTVYYLPEGVLEPGFVPKKWEEEIIANDDWLPCLPLLDPVQGILPAGDKEQPPGSGLLVYIPGNGGPAVSKRAYMAKYGINPEIWLALMRKTGSGVHVGK